MMCNKYRQIKDDEFIFIWLYIGDFSMKRTQMHVTKHIFHKTYFQLSILEQKRNFSRNNTDLKIWCLCLHLSLGLKELITSVGQI